MSINFDYKKPLDQRKLSDKIFLTLGLIALGRLGSFIPIPDVDQAYLYSELKNIQILNFFSSFAQGNFFILGVFSLGILPNINASILIQLLVAIFPPLKRLQREEGEAGRNKITYATRVLTGLIALQYGFIIGFYLKPFVFGWNVFRAAEIALILTFGSLVILFFSEIINKYGVGNGTSLFIFVNISSSLPLILENLNSSVPILTQIIFGSVFLVAVFCIIIMQNATRKIKVVSIKQLLRVSPRKEDTYLPFRLNPSGIMPLIFASSLINLLVVAINKFGLSESFKPFYSLTYTLGYFLFTLFFSYFYSTVVVNPIDLSKDLKNMSFTIPTIAPGASTMKFLQNTLNRLALLGGLFLAVAVSLPSLFINIVPDINGIKGFGSTSLIILVGVTIDLSRQIRTYLISESYDNIEMQD